MSELTVLGIGNILMRDEGVGVRVLEAVAACHDWPDAVEFVDGGAGGLNLLTVLERARGLIVFDAAAMGLPAGEFRVITPDQITSDATGRVSLHDVPFIETLRLCEQFSHAPSDVTILAIQPASVEHGAKLSAELQAALGNIAAEGRRLVEEALNKMK